MNKTISIIIPCFNESACLQLFFNELQTVCNNYSIYNYEFIFVNDGSSDASSELLNRLASSDNRVTVLEFSRNFGKEAALTAGFQVSNGDMVIPIDADLQHPPHIIFDLIDRYNKGDVDVVIALRNSREQKAGYTKKRQHFFITSKILSATVTCLAMPEIFVSCREKSSKRCVLYLKNVDL